jgi:tRNA(adenine34) deaminase
MGPPADDPRLHERFMREALALADAAALLGEVPVGAVIVRGEAIVGRGHNRRETDRDPTAHAEVLAIRAAAAELGTWRLAGCRLYVTMEPCAMCAGAAVLARVDACVYGCADPKGGFVGTLADLSRYPGLNHAFAVVPGVLAEEASDRLQRFFRSLRARRA